MWPYAAVHANTEPEPPTKPGLIWNRSGLPAVFPLQVKTTQDQTYLLTLIDQPSGKAVLAAHVIGGQFFKILVPPGTFVLRFASPDIENADGRPTSVFSETDVFELSEPLVFRTLGLSTKAGHVVDLRDNPGEEVTLVRVKPQYICQSVSTVPFRVSPYRGLPYRYSDVFRDPARDIRLRRYSAINRHTPYELRWPGYLRPEPSRFTVRSSYCD